MLKHLRRQQQLDRLALTLVTSFVFLILLMLLVLIHAASVGRLEVTDVSTELQANVEELQDIAIDLDRTVDQLSTVTGVPGSNVERLDSIGDTLVDVNQQLQAIEADIDQTLEEAALVEEALASAPLPIADTERQDVDRLFNIVVWLIGILCIAAAITLIVVVGGRTTR